MHDRQSLSHALIIPDFREKVVSGGLRRDSGPIPREDHRLDSLDTRYDTLDVHAPIV